MEILTLVGDDIHEAALARAVAIDSAVPASGGALQAPLSDDVRQWLDRIWDATEGALLRARRQGKEAAAVLVQKVETLLQEAGAALADRWQALRDALAARLNAYLAAVVDAAVALVRPTLAIGSQVLRVTTVTVQQRLLLSGSIKASLEEIVELVAEGELTLSAQYGSALA
jgi:hypothetical protein